MILAISLLILFIIYWCLDNIRIELKYKNTLLKHYNECDCSRPMPSLYDINKCVSCGKLWDKKTKKPNEKNKESNNNVN